MPVLTRAVLTFPSWGLAQSTSLHDLIQSELYSDDARFIIPTQSQGYCQIHERTCFARFSVIEQHLREHDIPYDVIFTLEGEHNETQRSWRPGMSLHEEREFPLLNKPMVDASDLAALARVYPDSIPTSIVTELISDASYPVSPLDDWYEPNLAPIEPDRRPDAVISAIVLDYDMTDTVTALVTDEREAETKRLLQSDLQSQIRYLATALGWRTLRETLSNAFKRRENDPLDNKPS